MPRLIAALVCTPRAPSLSGILTAGAPPGFPLVPIPQRSLHFTPARARQQARARRRGAQDGGAVQPTTVWAMCFAIAVDASGSPNAYAAERAARCSSAGASSMRPTAAAHALALG